MEARPALIMASPPIPARHHLSPALAAVVLLCRIVPASSSDAPPPPHEGEFPFATLRNGQRIPLVGLGCASGVGKVHVTSALDAGYRYLDTAQSYRWGYREHEVGEAVDESRVDRRDIYIQSKIHPEDLGYEATKEAIYVSLDRLRVPSIDSMLLHKPRCWEGACRKEPEGTWQESWIALEELHDAGEIGAIGICDVDDALLDELLRQRVKPHVIQNWMDPFHQDKHIRERCKEEGIQYQAYSSLGTQWAHHRGHKENPVLTNPTLRGIADKHGCDVAQVVINWATRHGVSVLPASTNPTRQRTNLDSFGFDLSDEEMRAVDALDGTAAKAKARPNPNEVSVTFENRGSARVESFWVGDSSEEVSVGEIGVDDAISLNSFHGHRFVFKDGGGAIVGEHTVARESGPRQRHVVLWDEL